MEELQIFKNEEFGEIRTVIIDGEPWFVGKDVGTALGYADPCRTIRGTVYSEDKGAVKLSSPGGKQEMTIINESGLYTLILASKLPSAKRFKRWVTSEVLPAIRKTGKYAIKTELVSRPITADDYMSAARVVAGCRNSRLPLVLELYRKAGLEIPKIEKTVKECPRDEELINLLNRYTINELVQRLEIPKSTLSYYRNGIHSPGPKRRAYIIMELGGGDDEFREETETDYD